MRGDSKSPRAGGSARTDCLPYKALDIFPAPPPRSTVRSSHGRTRLPARKSLSSVGFHHSTGSSALFRFSGAASTTPSAAVSLSHQNVQHLDRRLGVELPHAGNASGLLGSLRATTLLDYGFMREFSLLKRKPLRDRNLSRLSAESIYSVRATQLALEQQGKREFAGVLLWGDLSEADRRKCHSAAVVTELHGHLQEQDVAALSTSTGYNRAELYGLWARFKALCSIAESPRGIDKDTFRRGLPQLALEDQFFVDRIFDILDADGSGILEWSEFIEVLSALEKRDAETRVRFLFRVYDLSGDGTIHRSEVHRFFLASLLIPPTDDVVAVASHVVDKLFSAVGRDTSDAIRVQDALAYIRTHPGDADIYKLLGRTMVITQRLVIDKTAPAEVPISSLDDSSPPASQ